VSHDVFLKGDPDTDSVRRHMERVLNDPRSRKIGKAAVAGAAAWGVWRLLQALAPTSWRSVARNER
jgi:hypothetical protein